jgi:hypothetical protein
MANSTSGAPGQAAASRRPLTFVAIAAGIVLLIIAAIYLTQPASSLPAFFPGHSAVATTYVHYKHAIAAGLLGVICFVFAWFNSGPTSAKQE